MDITDPGKLVNVQTTLNIQLNSRTVAELKFLSEYENLDIGEFLSILFNEYSQHIDDSKYRSIHEIISKLLHIYVQRKRYPPAILVEEYHIIFCEKLELRKPECENCKHTLEETASCMKRDDRIRIKYGWNSYQTCRKCGIENPDFTILTEKGKTYYRCTNCLNNEKALK